MTSPSTPPEDAELMRSILPPLLEDFQDWFARTVEFLDEYELEFISMEEQDELYDRICQAQREVSAAQMLADATNGQAGIDMPVMTKWHKLVEECWRVAMRLHEELNEASNDDAMPDEPLFDN
ncbi:MAG: DUF2605 domain-containing protein [Cyanobacteria bacterium J06632_3]